MWTIWDKTSEINGVSAEAYLARNKHLQNEETIFLKSVNGRVIWVMGRSALTQIYGIDPTLTNDEFIAAYEAKLAELEAQIPPPEETPEEEETDTTTYAELAQVYREGVNSIE